MSAVARTVALLQACDVYALDGGCEVSYAGDLLAIRHLTEALTRIVQAHPSVAEFAETFAARAAEALDLVEAE